MKEKQNIEQKALHIKYLNLIIIEKKFIVKDLKKLKEFIVYQIAEKQEEIQGGFIKTNSHKK